MTKSNLALAPTTIDGFEGARMKLEDIIKALTGPNGSRLSADGIEGLVLEDGQELLRQVIQAAIDARSASERREKTVTGDDGVVRNHVRSRTRSLMTTVGPVDVERLAYSARGSDSVMPLDEQLALPEHLYSFKVRRRIAEYAAEMSFGKARRFSDSMGLPIPQRQTEELAARAARDFAEFYRSKATTPSTTEDLLVLSFDGKGIAMRKEALRPATKKAAEERKPRLDKRRSKGERANLKRMAEVGTVYDVGSFPRTAADVVFELHKRGPKPSTPRPRARNKRVWASIERSSVEVVLEGFQEALRRDPERRRCWVVLVDGNEDQLDSVQRCAKKFGVEVTVVLDVIHVLEYLWKAGLDFNDEASKELETWVEERFLHILDGRASDVAGGIHRSATKRALTKSERKNADACAQYLINHAAYLTYDLALKAGLPIATGVIEGACRSLVQDRMGIAGARWGVKGAEAVLKLRAIMASGDFDEYWEFHLKQEHSRVYGDEEYCPKKPPTRLRLFKPDSSSSSS